MLSLHAGTVFQLWDASAVFEDITSVSDSTVSAYGGLKKSFDEVVPALFPSNIVGDIANNNIVAVLCLFAASAGGIFSDIDTILQLLLLVGIIYAVSFFHAYIFNGVLIKFAEKLNPVAFFKKIFQAQATAFTTQSSIGTLPVSIDALERRVGVSEEIANFTAPHCDDSC